MPIRIPNNLPARAILEHEGVSVMSEATANLQDIRPLRIGLLNLMPNKIKTETQFARLIGASPLQVELILISTGSHTPKNTSQEHMLAFYQPWEEIKTGHFDGLIITGAPIELLPFEQVNYWDELAQIYAWTKTHVHSTFNICWAAQAALHHFHKVPKHNLAEKAFGIYAQRNLDKSSPYLRGFADDFAMPISRWTEVRKTDLPNGPELKILLESDDMGLCLIEDAANRQLLMFNHIEYDTDSLGDEFRRDVAAHKKISPPANYFPQNDPNQAPQNRWRAHAHLLFGNWINQVYQTTPFDLRNIGKT